MILRRKKQKFQQKIKTYLIQIYLFLQTILALYALIINLYQNITSIFQLNYLQLLGLFILLPSLLIWLIARIQLGIYCTLFPVANKLITNGIYSKFRHPIYIFGIFIIIGYCLLLDNKIWLLYLLIIIPLQYYRAYRESNYLSLKFGETYQKYVNHVWL